MKTISKTIISTLIASTISLQALATDNIEFIPANGASFIVKDSTGQQRVLEVTADGDILVNGQLLDIEPPSISMIVEDTDNEYRKLLTISATDNVGIASMGYQASYPGTLDQYFYLQGEKSIFFRTSEVMVEFGKGNEVWVVAVDQAGNRTAKSTEFNRDTAITVGRYELTHPIEDTITTKTGLACGWPVGTFTIDRLEVYGNYNSNVGNLDDPNGAIANVTLVASSSFSLNAAAAPLTSPAQASVSGESQLNSGLGQYGTYTTKILYDVEFHDTSPASLSASWAYVCESEQGGIEQLGPYQMEGILREH